jgi:tetratricopeptide (TPR) repeat protein
MCWARSACYGAKGEWEQAAADAKKCIEIDPDFVKGYWRLATAHTELKQFDEAQEVLMKAMEKDPGVSGQKLH